MEYSTHKAELEAQYRFNCKNADWLPLSEMPPEYWAGRAAYHTGDKCPYGESELKKRCYWYGGLHDEKGK